MSVLDVMFPIINGCFNLEIGYTILLMSDYLKAYFVLAQK